MRLTGCMIGARACPDDEAGTAFIRDALERYTTGRGGAEVIDGVCVVAKGTEAIAYNGRSFYYVGVGGAYITVPRERAEAMLLRLTEG